MQQFLHSSILVSFLIIPIILNQIPMFFCANDEQYVKCSSQFDCANIRNLGYPFWGSNRPDYCGHPAFKLECTGKAAEITIMSETYRVLRVSDSDHSLRVVRTDFWSNVCPTHLMNNTIDSTIFDYGSDLENLSLYYDCSFPSVPLPGGFSTQFHCRINGSQMANYFMVEGILEDAETSDSSSEFIGTCKSRVIVPILKSEADVIGKKPTGENLKAALNSGFGLNWNANNVLCDNCQKSDGHCGCNPTSGEFICYCRNGPFPSKCGSGKLLVFLQK